MLSRKRKNNMINSTMDYGKDNSKKALIVIIILIVIILVLGLVLSIIYFSTDLMKSNKKLFMKYASQIVDEKDQFIDSEVTQYFEKKETSPYTNQGSYNANITVPEDENKFEAVNNFNVSFEGQVDNANKKMEQKVSLDFSDDIRLPFNFKRSENIMGILQKEYISGNYIAVDLDNLSNILGDSDIDYTNVLDSLTNSSNVTKWTEEEKEHIQNTYLKLIEKELNKDNFSKVEDLNTTGYTLTLKGEDIKNIELKLLETLKNDEIVLNKLNSLPSINGQKSNISASDIEKEITDIQNNNNVSDESSIEITVYTKNGKTNQFSITLNNEIKISISKQKNENTLGYKIEYEMMDNETLGKINLMIVYTGITSMQNVNENYVVGLETKDGSTKFEYTLNNTVNFDDSVEIEDFSDEETTMLTDYDQEQVTNFVTLLSDRISEVMQDEMIEAGIQNSSNPVLYSIPFYGMIMYYEDSMMSSVLDATTNEQDDMNLEEVNNRITTTLNSLYTDILVNQGLSNSDEDSIKSENMLIDSSAGTYSVSINEEAEDGEDFITITWTPTDESNGNEIEGKIIKEGESYKIESPTQ